MERIKYRLNVRLVQIGWLMISARWADRPVSMQTLYDYEFGLSLGCSGQSESLAKALELVAVGERTPPLYTEELTLEEDFF